MFPKCHEFTIGNGAFNDVDTQHFNYNITVICDNTTPSVEDLENHWRTLISEVDPIAKSINDESTDEKSEDESPPEARRPTTKYFDIETGVKKKLKFPTDVVLTLTPAASDGQWPAIVWKSLQFEEKTTWTTQVTWSDEVGFCVLKEEENGTLAPGDLKKQLNPGYSAILGGVGGCEDFEEVFKIPHESNHIGLCNTTDSRQRFALCTIDSTKPEEERFSPVVDLDPFTPSSPDVKHGFQCGPPVMLQAYDISGEKYRERTPIDTINLRPLFVNAASKPQAIDIRKLDRVTTFRLYSKDSNPGKPTILEMEKD
jgi:hypothetical protein